MGRLFWKIFLWFWLAMLTTLLGIVWLMAQLLFTIEGQLEPQITQNIEHQIEPKIQQLITSIQHEDISIVALKLQQISHSTPLNILLINSHNQELLGRLIPDLKSTKQTQIKKRQITSNQGEIYQLLIYSPSFTKGNFGRPLFVKNIIQNNPKLVFIRLGIATLLSGIVCFWLAWYLTRPVRQLREASYKLANGDLNIRIAHKMGKRRDEIADLGKDFDHMAQRLQHIVNSQKQLIQDVSHEIRSPLARLQLALALAQKKTNPSAQTEMLRIKKEADRLEELVSQILTIARLEDSSTQRLDEYIDVSMLLKHILDDAKFEITERSCEVVFNHDIKPTIQANGELLHRAFENIVRNALKYTAEQSLVFVNLKTHKVKPNWIQVSICDSGDGVSEEYLHQLFDPFFRVAESRDRNSGGYGLGLAIAKRAIQYHGGHITAKNNKEKGLCIEIELPLTHDTSKC